MSKFYSYAQFKEDVVLMRAINHVPHEQGFYIDVGANDPEYESVTKVFYDHGWRGINIDASSSWMERLVAERPRDINIHAAVTDTPGEITFYDQPHGGLGTTVATIADMHRDGGVHQLNATTVPAMTLTQICEAHAPADITFLKIDVEGGEGAVLRGLDLTRFRPWLMCIECHMPLRPEVQLWAEWQPLLTGAGYTMVYGDLFNRFYLSDDHPELADRFTVPIDDYRIYADRREIDLLKAERDRLAAETQRLAGDLAATQAELAETRAARRRPGLLRRLAGGA